MNKLNSVLLQQSVYYIFTGVEEKLKKLQILIVHNTFYLFF